ncbi:MAG: TetR/AcrR family transcriptional regulator [Syntrophobacteraceae bacterium]
MMNKNNNGPFEKIDTQGDNYVNTRDMIIQSAAKLFSQQGYHKTTMREIALSVNLTIGTIYHYINSKEELLFEICRSATNLSYDGLEETMNTAGSAERRIKSFIALQLRMILTHRDVISVYLKEYNRLSPDNQVLIRSGRKKHEKAVEDIIASGIENNEFINIDVKMAALCFLGMCNWATYWFKEDGTMQMSEIIDIFSEIFAHGIVRRERSILPSSQPPEGDCKSPNSQDPLG